MIGHWQKISLDEYLNNLTDYYNNCENPSFRLASKVQDLTQEEKLYVNANLDLRGLTGFENDVLLNSILQKSDKFNFAKHLLLSINIDLEVNSILHGESSFVYLVKRIMEFESDSYMVGYLLSGLYKRGYQSKECDQDYLRRIYKELPSNVALSIWCIARFAYILNDYNKFEKAWKHQNILFTILSFKLKKPIGINYPNLLGVANNAIQHYRENGDIILKSLHVFQVFREIIDRDKKRVFQSKMSDFQKYKPIQDKEFLDIILAIFPELETV